MFINRHKQSNIVEDYLNFLKKIEKLKPYIIKFNKNGTMKLKDYPVDCVVKSENL